MRKDKNIALFEQFSTHLKTAYNVCATSVYEYLPDSDIFIRITGEALTDVVVERYFSLRETMILSNAIGLDDNRDVKSRLITLIKLNNKRYMIALSSNALETFSKSDVHSIISETQTLQNQLEVK